MKSSSATSPVILTSQTRRLIRGIIPSSMSLSHQSLLFNVSPAAGATVTGPAGYYHGSYNHCTNDFYSSASDHLDFTSHHGHHQTALAASQHHHASAYASGFPAASYGMLTALQHGAGAAGAASTAHQGLSWYDGLEAPPPPPLDAGFTPCFDVSASAAFRRLPTVDDVKPETARRMTEPRTLTTGRNTSRTACRELNSDVDVSCLVHLRHVLFVALFIHLFVDLYSSKNYTQQTINTKKLQ